MVVVTLTTSPSLREPSLLSLTYISGTFREAAKLGKCLVSHLELQSEATNTT